MAGDDDMENNRKVSLNWGVINAPTILAIATVGWYLAAKQERQDARLDAIEQSRALARAENAEILKQLSMKVSEIGNITYRITIAENGITNANARIDRVGESIGQRLDRLQEGLIALTTKLEVLDQRLVNALPKKAEGPQFDRGGGRL